MSRGESVILLTQNACAEELAALERSYRREVMARLCFDRIGEKQEYLVKRFHDSDNWNQTAYFMLMRALDIGANRKSYEQLARILPYKYLTHVGLNRTAVEALLLGCAGLLPRLSILEPNNPEIAELNEDFEYNRYKYRLETMRVFDWQLTGIYGDNHPVVRLLQVAGVFSKLPHLLDSLLGCRTKQDVEAIFCNIDIPRWANRFLPLESRTGMISRNKAYLLGINVVAQMQIFYSEYTMREGLDTRGLDLLEQFPAENNTYVRRWARFNVVAQNALESQALLQLSKAYCHNLACEKCPFRRFLDAK